MSYITDNLEDEYLSIGLVQKKPKYCCSISKLCSANLVTFDDIPDWCSNNSHIHYGYRKTHLSYKNLLKSVFSIHNETFNIWTHLIGIFLFIGVTMYYISTNFGNGISIIPINIFLCSVIICFTNSVIMHTFYPHSKDCCTILCNLDYSGIFLMILGGYVAFLHYEFYCYTMLKIIYYLMLSCIGIVSLLLTCHPNSAIRSSSFLLIGVTSVIPIIHRRFFLKGDDDIFLKRSNEQLIFMCSTLVVILLGIFFYVSHFPERLHRDYFNIVFSSHNLFHICTIIAAYLYYTALIELFDYYKSHSECLT